MKTFVRHNKSTFLSLVSTVFLSSLLLLGIQGCSSSSSPPAPVITISNVATVEGDSGTTNLVFTATLDKTSTGAITFAFATADGTAEAATDYATATGTAEIVAGETSTTITVTVNGDTDIESDETLTLSLSSPVGATLAASSVTGTITSDDHANPSAYYTGSATVINPNDLTGNLITLADLRVMVSGNRIMMMNTVDNNGDETILYDATNLVVNGDTFTADVSIYINMHLGTAEPEVIQATMSGTVNENAGIVGVIGSANDTGAGTGTFEVLFNDVSNTPSSSASIVNKWDGILNGRIDINNSTNNMKMRFTLNTSGDVSFEFGDAANQGIFATCEYAGSILPISSERLYTVNLDLSNCSDGAARNGNYTGFAVATSLMNDTLAIAFTSDTSSGMAFLTPFIP